MATFTNTNKRVENMLPGTVLLANLKVFNVFRHGLERLIYPLNLNRKKGETGEKSCKPMLIKISYPNIH